MVGVIFLGIITILSGVGYRILRNDRNDRNQDIYLLEL